MAKIVGDIAVTVGADVSGLQAGMKSASRATREFGADTENLSAKMARISVRIAAVGVALAGAGVAIARSAASTAKNLQNQANLAGVTAEQFQKLSIAGEAVGFSQEKMADIFKDVNDKFGDFLANGAGPLKDFFENIAPQVGVTADQFARLSGPEALQLYVDSLQRAGVSQQQMTFYMEALANDATALIPIFANNGAELHRLGDEASRAGRIISNEAVAAGVEMDREFRELSQTLRTNATKAVLEYSDEIIAMGNWISEVGIPALAALAGGFSEFVSAIQPAINKVGEFIQAMALAVEAKNNAGFLSETGFDISGADRPGSIEAGRAAGLDGAGAAGWRSPGEEPLQLLRSSTDNGAALLERLREEFEAEQELKREFDEKDYARGAGHASRMEELEVASMESRKSAMATALGDISSLMASENEKLFRVGQAAALAEAIVDGHKAASSAWAKGMSVGGPPMAAAFTAASIAKTGAMIASIASASPRGSSGGAASGGYASGGFGGQSAAPTPVQFLVDGINPNDLYSGSSISSLLDRLQDEAGDRGFNVVFAQ